MKLRFDKNSLRLRLKKSDVKILQDHNCVTETVIFPGGSFTFGLLLAADATEINTRLKGQSIEVIVPFKLALSWINSDTTGLYHTIVINHHHPLNIIIEKDFACKNRSDEDLSDSFAENLTAGIPDEC